MIVRSLRWRLLLGAAAAILVALAVAWAFMVLVFERHLERRLSDELERDGLRLAAALSLTPEGAPLLASTPGDPRLATPAGGYYWQISNVHGALRSRSLWDADLPAPVQTTGAEWRLRRARGPFDQSLALLEREIAPDPNEPAVIVQLAQDMAPLASARDEFGREMAAFLFVLWLVLSAASWLQVHLGLRPLSRIRGDVAALRESPSARLSAADLTEIAPLTEAINALAETRERDLEQARRRAADLAHGLKTPLAALTAQVRRVRETGAAPADDGFERAIAAIGRAIDAELARVRAAVIRRGPSGHVEVRDVVERLVTVLEHTDRGEQLVFSVDVPAGLKLNVNGEDLSEILGAVLDNAMRFAKRQVRIRGEAGPQWTRLAVEDDGPGIAAADRGAALKRGARLDESGAGTGLGLAIAQELAEAAGGGIELAQSALGGLEVRFTWAGG